MAIPRENAADEENIGAEDFVRIDAAAQRQRVVGVGAEIPHGGETPSRQHLLHVRRERRGRRAAGVLPHGFREMDVAVPEAGDDGLAGAIDHARIGRDLHVAAAADRGDDAVGRDDDRIVERRGVRRRVDLAAHEREGLRVGRSADAGGRRKQAMEKRGAEQISDHAESSTG